MDLETLDQILTRSKYTLEFRSLLAQRDELTPAQAFSLFWWCNSSTRLQILARFARSREPIQRALEAYVTGFSDQNKAVTGRVRNALMVLYGSGETVDRKADVHLEWLENGNSSTFLSKLAKSLGVGDRVLRRILTDVTGEPLAVFCKASGMRRSDFRRLLTLIEKGVPLASNSAFEQDTVTFDLSAGSSLEADDDRSERLLDVFDRLSNDAAELVVSYWIRQMGANSQSSSAHQQYRKRIQGPRRSTVSYALDTSH